MRKQQEPQSSMALNTPIAPDRLWIWENARCTPWYRMEALAIDYRLDPLTNASSLKTILYHCVENNLN